MFSFKIRWLDFFIGILGIALFAAVFIFSASFPAPHQAQLGAAVFPRIVVILLAVEALYIALKSFKKTASGSLEIQNASKVALAFITLLAYGLLLKKVGFVILTPIFITLLLMMMKFSRTLINIITALVTTGAIYVVFKLLLSVPLPEGILGF